MAAMNMNGVICVNSITANINGEVFCDFVERSLIPQLSILPFNGRNPRSIVFFDNASIHPSIMFPRLIQSVGALVNFLPPYSPDLIPLKNYSKAVSKENDKAIEWIGAACATDIVQAAFVTADDCFGWFHHAGYVGLNKLTQS